MISQYTVHGMHLSLSHSLVSVRSSKDTCSMLGMNGDHMVASGVEKYALGMPTSARHVLWRGHGATLSPCGRGALIYPAHVLLS